MNFINILLRMICNNIIYPTSLLDEWEQTTVYLATYFLQDRSCFVYVILIYDAIVNVNV